MIESFRNDLFPGHKSSVGVPPELLAQFPSPRPRSMRSASYSGRWSSSRPTTRSRGGGRPLRRGRPGRRILVCTRTRTWRSSSATSGSCSWDRRRGLTYDDAGVRAKWGSHPPPSRIARPGRRRLGRLPRAALAGGPRRTAVLARYGHSRTSPDKASAWRCPAWAAVARSGWRHCPRVSCRGPSWTTSARLRTAADGVPIRQHDADELRWDGAPRDA